MPLFHPSIGIAPHSDKKVLGTNGSGKSTLLKIMASIDKEIEGEAIPMTGLKIGYLPQEPQLDPEHTVRQSVESGMGEVKEAQARLEEVYAAYAEEDADFDALAAEQAQLEAIIAASGAGTVRSTCLKSPPMRCACSNFMMERLGQRVTPTRLARRPPSQRSAIVTGEL